MKANIFRYSLGALLTGLAITACTPESFDGADPQGLPTVSGVDFNMTVDQATNQMVATYTPAPATYPVWIVNGVSYSTLDEVGYRNDEAGTHTVELRLANRNGISQAGIVKEFTFNETKVDYSADFRKLCDKEWRVAREQQGHLGCGPAGTAGIEWYSAKPDEKVDFGIYDDRVVFTHTTSNPKGGDYSYSAGEDGLTFVNKGTTRWGAGAESDFNATIGDQKSSWSFEVRDWKAADGTVTKQPYIKLADNTIFPYISADVQYESPWYRIEELTAKKLALVYDNPDGSIAWRIVLTNGEVEEPKPDAPVMDWNPASAANLWAPVESGEAFDNVTPWFADGNWGQIADPVWSHENGVWNITIPEGMGALQWQGQFPILTKVPASAAKKYNFYCVVEADADCPGVTIKLAANGDDNNFFMDGRHDIKADEPYIYKLEAASLPKDAEALKLIFDFGGTPAGAHIKVSNIYLEEAVTLSYEDANNLWKTVDGGAAFLNVVPWFANDSWSQIGDPVWKHEGNKWTLTIPEGMGSGQWQGQFPINTSLTALAADAYNFSCKVEADADCPGVTIKLTETNDPDGTKHDNNFFFGDRHAVKADEPFVYTAKGVKLAQNDAHALSLIFDFGGTPVGTKITISDIILEKAE